MNPVLMNDVPVNIVQNRRKDPFLISSMGWVLRTLSKQMMLG